MGRMSKTGRGTVEILIACAIWGYGYIVIKNAFAYLPLNSLMSTRYVIAAAAMLLIFLRRLRTTTRHTLLGGAAMGLLLYASQYCQTAALGFADTTAGEVAFITALYVVLVPFLNAVLRRKFPERKSVAAAALAIVGLFILEQGGIGATSGCAVALLGSGAFAVHILVIDHFTKSEDPILLTVWQFVFAAVYSCIVQELQRTPSLSWNLLQSVAWPLIYLGIFSTLLGFLMQTAGQKNLSPELSSILLATEAVFGLAFSAALASEALTLGKLLGCGLMLAAVILSELTTKTSPRKKERLPEHDKI